MKTSLVNQVLLEHVVDLLSRQQRRHLSQRGLAAASDVSTGVVAMQQETDQVGVDLLEEVGARLTTAPELRQVAEQCEGCIANGIPILTRDKQYSHCQMTLKAAKNTDLLETGSDAQRNVDEDWLHVLLSNHPHHLRQPVHRLQRDVIVAVITIVHTRHYGRQHGGGELVHERDVTAGDVAESPDAELADEQVRVDEFVEERAHQRLDQVRAASTLDVHQLQRMCDVTGKQTSINKCTMYYS